MLHFNHKYDNIINTNDQGSSSISISNNEPIWKILILDGVAQKILSPIMKVNDLREHGVTLFLQLHGERQAIPDVPVIYFIAPTKDNIRRVCQDLDVGLYSPPSLVNAAEGNGGGIYLNFTSSIPRILLEELAQHCVQHGTNGMIVKVYDQYLDYVCLENNLFTLVDSLSTLSKSMTDSFAINKVMDDPLLSTYRILNSPQSDETLIDQLLDTICSGLFSTLLSLYPNMGTISTTTNIGVGVGGGGGGGGGQQQPPLIVTCKGTSAEALGEKLYSRIQSHLLNNKQIGGGNVSSTRNYLSSSIPTLGVEDTLQRGMLLILDRNYDLVTPLRHSSTYNALVHDVLGMKLNRVALHNVSAGNSNSGGGESVKTFDIDIDDQFWKENSSLPFPTVAENVDVALNAYKSDMAQLTRNHGVNVTAATMMSTTTNDDFNRKGTTAEDLKIAINVLPEMTERKRIIDLHLQLSTALLEAIKQRGLGEYYQAEQELLLPGGMDDKGKGRLLQILKVNTLNGTTNSSGTGVGGKVEDKMRLYLACYLTHPTQFSITTNNGINQSSFAIECEKALRESGCDMKPLEFIKKLQSTSISNPFGGPSSSQLSIPGGTTLSDSSKGGRRTRSPIGASVGVEFLGTFGSRLLSSIKNFLPEGNVETPLTRMIDSALERITSQIDTNSVGNEASIRGERGNMFIIHDPAKSQGSSRTLTSAAMGMSAFNHLMVFIVGGVNYEEYNHLREHVKKITTQSGGMIWTIGSTEMLKGEDLLKQCI